MTRSRDVADTQDNLGGAVAPYVAGKNAVINGGFDIWQRGTSVANSSVGYTADRYFLQSYNAMTVSRQATGDSTNLPNITYAARVQRDSGATGVNFVYFTQSIESLNAKQFAGKTITFSFYARRGANFSGSNNAIVGELISGTGTDQVVLFYTGASSVIGNVGATLTTTWQRFTFTGTVPATSNELGFYIGYTPVGTAGANDYFEMTGIQIEIGAVATPFARAGGSIGGELALCQRYYWRATSTTDVYTIFSNSWVANTTGNISGAIIHPVPMRTVPTSVDFANLSWHGTGFGNAITAVGIGGNQYMTNSGFTTTGVTVGTFYRIQANNNSNAFLGFSAEL